MGGECPVHTAVSCFPRWSSTRTQKPASQARPVFAHIDLETNVERTLLSLHFSSFRPELAVQHTFALVYELLPRCLVRASVPSSFTVYCAPPDSVGRASGRLRRLE